MKPADRFSAIVAQIAEGMPIPWEALEKDFSDPEDQVILQRLRQLADTLSVREESAFRSPDLENTTVAFSSQRRPPRSTPAPMPHHRHRRSVPPCTSRVGADHTIRGTGQITCDFVNLGTIRADADGRTLQVYSGAKSNEGLLLATGNGVLSLDAATIPQSGAGTIRAIRTKATSASTAAPISASTVSRRSTTAH